VDFEMRPLTSLGGGVTGSMRSLRPMGNYQ